MPRSVVIAASIAFAVGVVCAGPASARLVHPDRECPGGEATVEVFHPGGVPLADWRENLAFDGHGTMWVSHVTGNRVEGYAADGTLVATVEVRSPGGIRLGPDGYMYVNVGLLPSLESSGIMRFDPTEADPQPHLVVDGLSGINGLAIDAEGNFYLGREFAGSVLKVRSDGSIDEVWTAAADVFGTNGVKIVGDTLYATVTADLSSPVEAIPLEDPASHSTMTRLSPPLSFPKVLDDLAGHRGKLLVTAYGAGELIQVDPGTGASCVVTDDLTMPTSVRVPGDTTAWGDAVYVTEASGRILRITL